MTADLNVSGQGHMSATVVARLPLTKSTRVIVFQLPASLGCVVCFFFWGGGVGGGSMEMVASFCVVLYIISSSLIYTVAYWIWSPFVLSFKFVLCLK